MAGHVTDDAACGVPRSVTRVLVRALVAKDVRDLVLLPVRRVSAVSTRTPHGHEVSRHRGLHSVGGLHADQAQTRGDDRPGGAQHVEAERDDLGGLPHHPAAMVERVEVAGEVHEKCRHAVR